MKKHGSKKQHKRWASNRMDSPKRHESVERGRAKQDALIQRGIDK